jgi:hypothetical protein
MVRSFRAYVWEEVVILFGVKEGPARVEDSMAFINGILSGVVAN